MTKLSEWAIRMGYKRTQISFWANLRLRMALRKSSRAKWDRWESFEDPANTWYGKLTKKDMR